MAASPYLEKEARVIALAKTLRLSTDSTLRHIERTDPSADKREAAARELIRRSLFETKANRRIA